MPEDLTTHERRLTLTALWSYKLSVIRQIERLSEDDHDQIRIQLTGETCDDAARKLGGDPAKNLYGAGEL